MWGTGLYARDALVAKARPQRVWRGRSPHAALFVDQLSPALREKVLAAASELGYCGPDPMARGLRMADRDTEVLRSAAASPRRPPPPRLPLPVRRGG
jgi:DNA-binding LacI/PurR family transcriptional regulator